MSIDRYIELLNSPSDYKSVRITVSIPKPKDVDYRRGYITRYFVQKTNDINSPIYEVSVNDIAKFKNNPFYTTVSLDWRINGEPTEVKKSNSESIRIASETIPKIQLYLPNLLQFHKK